MYNDGTDVTVGENQLQLHHSTRRIISKCLATLLTHDFQVTLCRLGQHTGPYEREEAQPLTDRPSGNTVISSRGMSRIRVPDLQV